MESGLPARRDAKATVILLGLNGVIQGSVVDAALGPRSLRLAAEIPDSAQPPALPAMVEIALRTDATARPIHAMAYLHSTTEREGRRRLHIDVTPTYAGPVLNSLPERAEIRATLDPPVVGEVRFEDAALVASVHNLSAGGLCLLIEDFLASRPARGDRVEVEWGLPGIERPLVRSGHVRWLGEERGRCMLGVQFARSDSPATDVAEQGIQAFVAQRQLALLEQALR